MLHMLFLARHLTWTASRMQDHISQERFKQMPASKGKPFILFHCWNLLEHSEKWQLRDQEAPPKKDALNSMDNDDDSDVPKGGETRTSSMGGRRRRQGRRRRSRMPPT